MRPTPAARHAVSKLLIDRDGAGVEFGRQLLWQSCGELLRLRDCLWTFTRVAGVEPTNNAAERAPRHAVIWRRTSGGTDSETGSRFVERMLSVAATCRQRGIDVLEFLTGCHRARLSGEAVTSLVLTIPPITGVARASRRR